MIVFDTQTYKYRLEGSYTTPPNPSTIYLKYSKGWYGSESLSTPLTQIVPPTKTGYTFNGYYTEENGNGTKVINTDGSIVSGKEKLPQNNTKEQRLYAHFTAIESKVTFNTNTGSAWTSSECASPLSLSGNECTKTVTYDSTYGPLPTPKKTGYTFDGWYTQETGGTKISSTTKVTITSSQTLYAHWSINSYTCAGGKYLAKGAVSCANCTAGNYCTGGTYNYDDTKDQGITACPSGMTSNAGSSAKTSCKVTCAGGKYLAKSASSCANCTAGNYCTGGTYNYDDTKDQGITACPSGMTSDAGSSAKTSCKVTCAAGTYLAKNTTACANCPAGSACAGGTCNFSESANCGISACGAGKFSGAKASTCKNCAVGSYSSGSNNTACIACQPSGATGANGTTTAEGQSSCNKSCGKSNVASWNTASWSDNTTTNVCSIKTCNSGYTLTGGVCKTNEITVTINTAVNDSVKISGKSNVSADAKGIATAKLAPGTYTFTSTKAYVRVSGTWQYYSASVTISESNKTVNLYYGGAVYWFGNGGVSGSSLWSKTGGFKTDPGNTVGGGGVPFFVETNNLKLYIMSNATTTYRAYALTKNAITANGTCLRYVLKNMYDDTNYQPSGQTCWHTNRSYVGYTTNNGSSFSGSKSTDGLNTNVWAQLATSKFSNGASVRPMIEASAGSCYNGKVYGGFRVYAIWFGNC